MRLILLGILCLAAPIFAQFELLVGEKVSHSVGFYPANGGDRIASVPVGKYPHEITLSPDGKEAYVSDNGMLWMTDPGNGGNTISIIDLARRTRTGVIDLGRYYRPHGMDLDPRTGLLAVTVENPHGLLLVDPRQRKVVRYYELKDAAPHMVKFSADGKLAFVTNANTGNVAAVELASGKVTLIPTGARPQGSVLSPDGRLLYVTNSEANTISIIDTRELRVVGTIATGKGPARIWLTRDGKQLVYNLRAGEAVGFAEVQSAKQIATVALPGPPLSLSLSPDGKLAYAGVQSLDKICVISVAARRIERTIDTPKGSGPDAVVALPAAAR